MPVYLIDGYNLLFFLSYESPSLEQGRKKTVLLLAHAGPFLKGEICLVFDSSFSEKPNQYLLSANLKIEFAPSPLSADEYILEKIQATKNPIHIQVISSDKFLLKKAKELGAKALSLPAFLQTLQRKMAKKKEKENKPMEENPKEIARLAKIFKKLSEENG